MIVAVEGFVDMTDSFASQLQSLQLIALDLITLKKVCL
jgi:hypothetical protein